MKTKPVKIFVDCHVFDGSFQGTTTYIKGVYLEMIKNLGFEFYFASNNPNIVMAIFGTAKNIHYLQLKSHNKFYRLLVEIPKLIKQNKMDYAHFQYIVPPIKYCKYIVTIHDVLFLDYPQYFPKSYQIKNKFLFKWSAKKSNIVLTVSEFSKKQIQKHFKIQNIQITPNAVDAVYFEDYNKAEIKKEIKKNHNLDNYWLYTSRWEPRKNHHTLLEVFVENKFYKKYSLVFIGDKSIENKMYDNYYFNLSNEVKEKIITLNKVNFDQLVLLLRGANLSIYPSFAEGFGIPPIEALAAKIPSICSNTTAMSSFSFMSEFMFDPYDKADITRVINQVLQNDFKDEKRVQMQKIFSWKIAAEILEQEILISSNN